MSSIPVSTAALILLMQPVLSMTWDIIFFKRPTNIIDLIGFILSLGAIYLGATSRESENKNLTKTEEV
jgi:drug/metabolite transporter (DMT)-like permease